MKLILTPDITVELDDEGNFRLITRPDLCSHEGRESVAWQTITIDDGMTLADALHQLRREKRKRDNEPT